MRKPGNEPFVLGRREWLALPALGLPAIKAKIDTGARTSALHAFHIERYGTSEAPMVRFGVHPIPGRGDIEIFCSAPVAGMREVTSSNGDKETRIVISTTVRIGEREWPIEVGLTNREGMTYRMLLGRQAIGEATIVEPSASFRQPRLSYKLYRHMPRPDQLRRSLRIAFLTRKPDSRSVVRLLEAASVRGHVIDVIDPRSLEPVFDGAKAGMLLAGARSSHYDAVIARSAADAHLVRQFEVMGSIALNAGDAIARLGDPLAVRQALARAAIDFADHGGTCRQEACSGAGECTIEATHVFLLVDGMSVAGIHRHNGRLSVIGRHAARGERVLAEQAARALQLGLCTIDVASGEHGLQVVRVSAQPSLPRFERVTGKNAAEVVIVTLETKARSWVRTEVQDAD